MAMGLNAGLDTQYDIDNPVAELLAVIEVCADDYNTALANPALSADEIAEYRACLDAARAELVEMLDDADDANDRADRAERIGRREATRRIYEAQAAAAGGLDLLFAFAA